jgi:His-Xaa-Ser system protein HxsD
VSWALEFDPAVVSVDAIQRAAYRMSDRLSIDLRAYPDTIACTLHIAPSADADELVAEFRNEALDQVLRERIRLETEASRNLILALAFSKTGVLPEA